MNTYIDGDGFEMIVGTNKRMHTYIIEGVLGRKLKKSETIHHIDENRANNENSNLIVCSRKFHPFLHKRINALAEKGSVNAEKCNYCGCYDFKENMYVYKKTGRAFHRECQNKYRRERYKRARG